MLYGVEYIAYGRREQIGESLSPESRIHVTTRKVNRQGGDGLWHRAKEGVEPRSEHTRVWIGRVYVSYFAAEDGNIDGPHICSPFSKAVLLSVNNPIIFRHFHVRPSSINTSLPTWEPADPVFSFLPLLV